LVHTFTILTAVEQMNIESVFETQIQKITDTIATR